MRSASLQRFGILHHRLNAVSLHGSGKLFTVALFAHDHRHCHILFGKGFVDIDHAKHLLLRLFGCGMGGMPLLPEKLRGSQKEAGSHLPAYHISPLVNQYRQVAIGLDPLLVG